MKRITALLLLIVTNLSVYGANDGVSETSPINQEIGFEVDSTNVRLYDFTLFDSPGKLFTMRQFNDSYLSAYRIGVRGLNKTVSPLSSFIIQNLVSLFVVPLTHEEGHRSILTHNGIGSISNPFFNSNFAAYVEGVTDSDLIEMRDTKLPQYIRLHTAGIESDYALTLTTNSLISWGMESKSVLWVEYLYRKVSIIGYTTWGLFGAKIGLNEESNELKRDIVGHDIYGMARHLYRPDMEFYRYTEFDDLTSEEQKFVKRIGWRGLLNLLDPLLYTFDGFKFKNGNKLNFAIGYGLTPFGDYIDENVWLSIGNINMHYYLRQYQNRSTWFPELGANVYNLQLAKRIYIDGAIHAWYQPENMDFNTSTGKFGGAIDLLARYRINKNHEKLSFTANLGILAKTKGFLLQEMSLDRHVGVRVGVGLIF